VARDTAKVTQPSDARVERSGPAVRTALAELAPADCSHFELEFRAALRRADQDLDLAGPESVLQRWWVVASRHALPLSVEEQGALERARAGDFRGLYHRTIGGDWAQC
jgi:hypothetical protein